MAGFGTRGVPGGKVATEWNTKEIWLRKKIMLPAAIDKISLDVHHDEDVEIFFNGNLVFQATGFTTKYERIELDAKATKHLKPGANILGVTCKQSGGGQYIDVRLVDGYDSPEALVRHFGDEVLGKAKTKRYLELARELEASRKTQLASPGFDVMAVVEQGRNKTHILLRGLPQALGDEVPVGVPEVLAPAGYTFPLPKEPSEAEFAAATSDVVVTAQGNRQEGTPTGRRRALAEWLVDARNPLTARVFVNRLWQYHFGRGIVGTSNDFGKLGELPTHPELLDWLALEFMRGASDASADRSTNAAVSNATPSRAAPWSIKAMHKLLMLSNTYRLSSQATPDGLRLDPADQLYWRFPMRRLAAEEVRDSILAVTGKLNPAIAGPSVYPPIPKEVFAGQSRPGEGWPISSPSESSRRSVYVHVKRSLQLPILAQYDQADTDSSCAVRYTTTVPTQSLGMLNGEFIHEQASTLARRLEQEHPNDLAAQIRRAIRLTTQRNAPIDEIGRDVAFVQRTMLDDKLTAADALKLYCLLALNTNEFFYLD
ncbi:MAG: DUF1553 domain-containing protein [Planctomycetia bacterium]|nr:DUF1553 domain-containing protein [Planctomycetia bacterium]